MDLLKNDTIKSRIELGLLFLLIVCIIPRTGMQFDNEMWVRWAITIHHDGLGNAYDNPAVTYHPIYLYILYLYDLVQGSDALIVQNIYYLKIITLVFDFLPVVVLCCFRQNLIKERIPYLFLLLNIAYLFNTVVWGQIDAIHTSLIFLSFLTVFNRPVLSFLLFLLAFNTKQQAIIYIPVLLMLMLFSIKNFRKVILMLVTGAIVQVLILMPFILSGSVGKLYYTVTHLVDYYHNVSIGAFNMWYLIFPDAYLEMDYTKFLFFTYKQIGLILFFTASGLILLPLLFRLLKYRVQRLNADNNLLQMLMLACGLVSLYFFYFNTQMHERYSHSMLIFFFFYGVLSKNYKLYFLASIPYFLSLDKCFPDFLPVKHYKIIWAMQVIAIWYTLTVIYGSYEFFKQYKPGREYKTLLAPLKGGTNLK